MSTSYYKGLKKAEALHQAGLSPRAIYKRYSKAIFVTKAFKQGITDYVKSYLGATAL